MKKTIQFQNTNVSYSICGNGHALVLLHGFLESKAIWDDFTETLQKEFTVVAIDLPGHGESGLVAENHGMPLMAEAVKEVLKAENISEAVIVGHSMGGYVALQFAKDHTKMLKGMVLFHSHAGADSEETKINRQRTIAIVRQNRGKFIQQFIPDLFDQKHVGKYTQAIKNLQESAGLMSPEAIIAALSGMRDRQDQMPFLSKTELPVFFIIGRQDSRMPYGQLIEQAMVPLHGETLLLEDVGHMGFIEAPAKTLQAITHFALRCFED
ncbi:MAG: alpha/beta hydrolase [Bacteroidota bacterium]